MVKLFGQQGLGWGNGQAPADGLNLCVRLVDSDYAVDTGWLDGNAPYDGISMPQGNGAGVLLLESSTPHRRSSRWDDVSREPSSCALDSALSAAL